MLICFNVTMSLQVFLQHLPSLSTQPSFPELWITVLDYMDEFLKLENSDLLVSHT